MSDSQYVSAKEAAHMLDVTVSTLYAYVSRGLIRSEEAQGSKRKRRYRRADIERLQQRKERRRNPEQVAAQALHFGAPVLSSAITLISEGRLYYRGWDAVTLAQTETVEAVARLIWLGDLEAAALDWARPYQLPAACAALLPQLTALTPMERFQVVLPMAAMDDLAAYQFTASAVAQTGSRILQLLTLLATAAPQLEAGLAETLQRQWVPQQPQAKPLLQAALILCADHELNVSSFTGRCVASAQATPYAVVSAGLSALQGAKHGGYTERVAALLREIAEPAYVQQTITSRLKRGEPIPGFGHRLYPEGDPRAAALLGLLSAAYPQAAAVALGQATMAHMAERTGLQPTIDFGLAILARTLGLPRGAGLALFALGRTIGWLGQAIEQYQLDQMIRPRARYIGPQPQ